jgi:large-conductance mechanosensitive channel
VVDINRLVAFLIVAFLIFFIITQPRTAANAVQSVAYTLREAAESVTVFFRELT